MQAKLSHVPGDRRLEVTFTNDTDTPATLARCRAFLDTVTGPYLKFEPEATYLGIMVKRGPYTDPELVTLAPGESLTATVALDESYELPADLAGYRVRYFTYQPLKGPGTMTPVESEWITLS